MQVEIPDIDSSKLEESLTEEVTDTDESGEEEKPEVVEKTEEEKVEEQKIKLGEREYGQAELDELVALGSKAKEVGESHGGFDKFVSEYGRKSQRIGELNQQLEEIAKKPATETDTPEENSVEQAKAAMKQLGIVTTDQLDTYYENKRQGERLLESCTKLEGEIDGTDGRPKFDSKKVLEFMLENPGFKEPQKAYNVINMDAIAEWKAGKLTRKGGFETNTETPSSKQPEEVTVNEGNLRDLLAEQFN